MKKAASQKAPSATDNRLTRFCSTIVGALYPDLYPVPCSTPSPAASPAAPP